VFLVGCERRIVLFIVTCYEQRIVVLIHLGTCLNFFPLLCSLQLGEVLSLEYGGCDHIHDRLSGLVVTVPGYRSRGPFSISGSTRFSGK
jgi:hypothetical protein